MAKRQDEESINWTRAIVHGLIGAVLGAAVGVSLWIYFFTDLGLWVTLGMALGCGILAAVYGDRFWDSYLRGPWLNPLNWS